MDGRLQANRARDGGCGQLVGCSPKLDAVYDTIRRVANLPVSVLITGESGTGKELVARAIHDLGNRAKCPFVAVSCGAIPESLIEAELFGSEKGAYTGSQANRAGYFEQVGAGTLFLDEIGELSPNTQVKLLRVLQQREFTRLGSSKPLPLSARIVFATNRNLQQMVEAGSFRQDLYFRLNVIGVHLPALRDRSDDIPQLAEHFLRRYAEEYGSPARQFEPEVIKVLCDYEWPGNIRELENAVQTAAVMASEESIRVTDLPGHLRHSTPNVLELCKSGRFDDLMQEYKVRLATNAVLECNGNKTLAAQRLRLSRAYLHRLIRTA